MNLVQFKEDLFVFGVHRNSDATSIEQYKIFKSYNYIFYIIYTFLFAKSKGILRGHARISC